jgi:hypothetical protein
MCRFGVPGCDHHPDMTTQESLRGFALALPEATEQDHHGMVSFRVGNKIFATVPDHEHIRIMVDESEILAAAAENPLACEPFYWGKRLACVVVDIRKARPGLVTELLTEAWLRKASKRLAEGFGHPQDPDD